MKLLTYAFLGAFALQPLTATTAAALEKIQTSFVQLSEVTSKNTTIRGVENALKTCSSARGWKFSRVAPGKLIGQLTVRGKHYVEVDVEYSSQVFKISYRDSRNMKYNAEKNTIHKRYNSWIENLTNDVIFCLK
ncbi:hypothetical protein [Pseudophaeobacter arcticus]|jgi:hypothetical protein|uniref:hypothetical protein n=1 Tax=Pseudophaeobacter arcticus TaxID=385492 RepID=UPI0003F5B50D|nr:hypothetical protein [Pseudophaeobacter arcticus]